MGLFREATVDLNNFKTFNYKSFIQAEIPVADIAIAGLTGQRKIVLLCFLTTFGI